MNSANKEKAGLKPVKLKKIGICVLGIIVSFLLLSLFDELELRFAPIDFGDSRSQLLHVQKFVFRLTWFYSPIIVAFTSILVALLDRGKYRMLMSLISIFPYLVFDLSAGSLKPTSFLFSAGYSIIAFLSGLAVPRKIGSELQ